ncbi:LysM peptidoglycan-binding domain-containing protein [Marinihelvus fidelis]|uniref:LysM peptidoglycan-binding domain-containing protein n=2 Tax=Marinihelvus fidelis TaxID=2613842 RepID=A0A5N0TA93_9GAMM|nr:LysM peptidoglycan-binding domain-containing protein [Marinihelvus fidelis]
MLLSGAVMAQDVSVRTDHPDEYIVVKGDTLWDISGKFLDHPWQWPAIWHANQQIENPHLIYPGDKLRLVYVDGQPRLMVDRGRPTVRLSPDARVTNREAVPPIPHEELAGLIRNMQVVSAEQFDALPYVVANNEQRLRSMHKDRTYARGVQGSVGDYYAVMRLGNIYVRQKDGNIIRVREPGYGLHAPVDHEYHPGFWESTAYFNKNKGDVIGFELYQVAEVMLSKQGDPAILTIGTSQGAVQEGDRIMPLDRLGYPDEYVPHAMSVIPDGMRVLGVEGNNRLVGHLKMVSISGGRDLGVEPGHVFSAFSPGAEIRDRVKYPAGTWTLPPTEGDNFVTLPDEFNAHIMVFRVFDEVSYALIMAGDKETLEDDILKHPDETL